MQPQERRFADPPEQPTVYRFQHQNPPAAGWQPQGMYAPKPHPETGKTQPEPSAREQHRQKRRARRKRRFAFWRNIFAVIGVIAVLVELARYVVIPLLVYLNVLTGGAS